MEKITGVMRKTLKSYARLPSWVVVAQLFLGVGWLRAGVAHAMSADWWRGDELLSFIAQREDRALPLYGVFLDAVEAAPNGFAAVVVCAEFGVAAALLANVRQLHALAVGSFFNLHFIAAGQVNPSIFSLIISACVVGFLLEATLATERIHALARTATVAGLVAIVALAPAIDTMSPTSVVEDPASVLMLLVVLVVGALWASYARRVGVFGARRDDDRVRWATTELREARRRTTPTPPSSDRRCVGAGRLRGPPQGVSRGTAASAQAPTTASRSSIWSSST